ncbi:MULTISPECIES: polysaccharide deacetylase family protein [unclassified Methanoculleus]|uniref:polysaccharide deacetylase family protein n=1 Tax=unclassified Methanoculleus TaxID=2619537 RepID=UPI0025DD91ED|nr:MULTISPECIES: polysaccharide deacetylase family protein [unclassified Methanoculleus]MCK9297340.1 polysaccharide deacetylase family protein [Methanoculleus sp.]MDD2254043.1 polysaccharide deacetylase family protein [Methanoculleus sp.]MDD2786601.1 polysaccharide deacetylase family protein [Methanoculleus sp.]MDD3216452.1 polysaccharide deacetylase family protein [Methanoculleus sp.]MDD4313352.1 polysaccharide deacetylase family protein [Methanoculleus sp.]
MWINALSIDLEFWWCNEFLTEYLPSDREDMFKESLRPIFALLGAFNVKATFFVLGAVAEKYPEVVHEVYQSGHEIACHAYSHKPLYSMDQREFEGELKKSLELLADYNPIGFRAPSFSLNNRTKWALETLEKYDFQYDSSIFPVRTQLYGVPDAPIGIYRPSRDDITVHDPEGSIIEFPLSIVKLGINIPISGGFYLRALPKEFLSWGVSRVASKRPANIYFHPHDLYPGPPPLEVPFVSRFITYHGVHTALGKLIVLMMKFTFMPIGTLLDELSLLSQDARVPAPPAIARR